MKFTVDEYTVELPENFVEEYLELTHWNREELAENLLPTVEVVKDQLIKNKEFSLDSFQKNVIEFFDNELAIYRK